MCIVHEWTWKSNMLMYIALLQLIRLYGMNTEDNEGVLSINLCERMLNLTSANIDIISFQPSKLQSELSTVKSLLVPALLIVAAPLFFYFLTPIFSTPIFSIFSGLGIAHEISHCYPMGESWKQPKPHQSRISFPYSSSSSTIASSF